MYSGNGPLSYQTFFLPFQYRTSTIIRSALYSILLGAPVTPREVGKQLFGLQLNYDVQYLLGPPLLVLRLQRWTASAWSRPGRSPDP